MTSSTEQSVVNNSLCQLFNELHRFEQNNDFDKALKTANKILNEDKSNSKALHCKIVSLIQLSRFEDAINQINKCDQNLGSLLLFEKAYCHYRLNNVTDALKILDNLKEADSDFRVKELRAQSLYRLEKFPECYEQYLELIKNSDDDYEDERETNLAAVLASLSIENSDSIPSKREFGEQTYELCYNKAGILLGQTKYEQALNKLNTAEDICRKTLEQEEATEEEIESELGIIRAQIGYCYQNQKKEETALRMYNQILKQKPTDVALLAVTSNNIVTINKDQNVFDSKKKMKTALADSADSKLSRYQRRTILFNSCLLQLHTNQSELCRKQVEELRKKFPEAFKEAILLEVALLCKEKKITEAINYLKDVLNKNTDIAIEVALVLSQLLIKQSDIKQACDMLLSLGNIAYKPGIISTLVSLYLSIDDKESVINVLTKAVQWYEQNKPESQELFVLYRENARFLMETGRAKDAVNLLEQLRKNNPKNPKIVALLISAYSQFNPQKAHEISNALPSIEEALSSVDVDALETSNWSLGVKYVKKSTKIDSSPAGGQFVKDKKHKKKKKKKLPKNYDSSVDPDPERWLPRYERSTFKKKKDKRNAQSVGKGTQGAISEVEIKPVTKTAAANTTVNSPQTREGPRQQRPTQKKKKKTGARK